MNVLVGNSLWYNIDCHNYKYFLLVFNPILILHAALTFLPQMFRIDRQGEALPSQAQKTKDVPRPATYLRYQDASLI